VFLFFRRFAQGEEPPDTDTGGSRVFSLDLTSGLLAINGAIGAGAVSRSALCCCGVCTT